MSTRPLGIKFAQPRALLVTLSLSSTVYLTISSADGPQTTVISPPISPPLLRGVCGGNSSRPSLRGGACSAGWGLEGSPPVRE